MEQMQRMQQNGEARLGHGEGLDEQLADWSAELFRDPPYRNTWADAEHGWRLESAARTRLIIKKQLREEIEREMANELGLPANWRGNKLKSLVDWHEKMACLARADAAPRCEHVFQDGTRCGSPRMKAGELCYAHERMARVRPKKLNLLAMEDANAIMLNIMEINRALVDEEITEKRAGMLLYSQQLGLQVLGKLTFQKTRPEAMVRLEEEFTAMDAKGAKEQEEIAADPRHPRQAGAGAGAGERRQAQIGEEGLTAMDAKSAILKEQDQTAECAQNAESGINELSALDDGMERRGEDCQDRRNCQRLKIEELALTPAHEARAGDPGDRVIGKPEELTASDESTSKRKEKEEDQAAAEIAERTEGQGFAKASADQLGGGALPPSPSHELKDLGDCIPAIEMEQVSRTEQVGLEGAGA